MAICKWCKGEMSSNNVKTCIGNEFIEFPDGEILESSSEHFNEPSGRCHGCNIKHGGRHHPGCDVERCPRCGGQWFSCGCLDDDMEGDFDL